MLQGEFGFGAMKPIRLAGNGPRLSLEERNARIVELRRQNVPYKKIKAECRCSEATVLKVLKRDAPNLVFISRKVAPKKDPRSAEELLALPPTDDEPLAKIGVHFFDIGYRQCRYIVAKDPDDKLARFCGESTVGSCSWCAAHLEKVSMPARFKAEAA